MSDKLAIIAGSGRMPALLLEACQDMGRDVFVLGLEGFCDSIVADKTVRLGAVGEALKALKQSEAKEVIMAGSVGRPTLSSLRPDFTATMWIAKLGTSVFSGDDALLGAIVTIMEKEGFKVVGAEDVLAHLLAPAGVLGKHKPTKQHEGDIARGMKVAKHLGEMDIGQAVVVENGYVLGVEAAEGTDALLLRCGTLSQHIHGDGVLVKAKKPGQDARADLPSIGVSTVEHAQAAGLAGIAVEAGGSLLLDKEKLLACADKLGLFVVGVSNE